MGYIFYIFLLFFVNLSNASEIATATDKAIEATLAYPEVKGVIDVQTKRIIKMTEMDDKTLRNFTIVLFMVQKGKVDTSKVGNMRYKLEYGYIKPDIYYKLNGNEFGGVLNYKWSFK